MVDEQCDWTGHDRVNLHHRAKLTGRDGKALHPKRRANFEVAPLGLVRWSRAIERRATAFADVTVEGELRDDEHVTLDVQERPRHLPGIVFKDAERRELVCHPRCGFRRVASTDPEIDQHAESDRADTLARDFDSCFLHTLCDSPHVRELTTLIEASVRGWSAKLGTHEAGLDHFEIRAGTTEHYDDVCQLARHLNTVNLPDNPATIRGLLETSERSFSGELRDPRTREYVFVLWDDRQRRVIGTSMIIAQLGRRGVPYIYLEVRSEEKYSGSLDRHFVHRVLTTRYSYDGPTEIGGLVMHPDYRRSPERLGSLISYVRFLYIAMRRKDFRDECLAELLPPFEPDGSSLLWESYGRRFTGLSYRDADQLSKSNKEFVSGLFPSEIYATLLSEEAQRVIGEVGPETRGVEKMLRRIGFVYAERVDPFDGGPHFTCATDRITLVREARELPVIASRADSAAAVGVRNQGAAAVSSKQPPARALLARLYDGPPYFRALPIAVGEEGAPPTSGLEENLGTGGPEIAVVPPSAVARLGILDRESAFWMPVP